MLDGGTVLILNTTVLNEFNNFIMMYYFTNSHQHQYNIPQL